jgi:hypothetical protein
MCLIIKMGPTTNMLPRDVFDYVYKRNDDGYGAMWVEDGRVKLFKAIGMSADDIYAHMESFKDRPDVVFHMRMRTHGPVTNDLCHPFRVLRKNVHGMDVVMMHNGVINIKDMSIYDNQSDTTAYKNQYLYPELSKDPTKLNDATWLSKIGNQTMGSRLVFLTDQEQIVTTGGWHTRYGCSVSNEYMLPKLAPAVSYYGGYPYRGDNVTQLPKKSETVERKQATADDQLRWYRIHANLRTGYAVDPLQLFADVTTMDDDDLEAMCKDVPDTAADIIKSLCDYIMTEMADSFDWQDIFEMQSGANHLDAMKRIAEARQEAMRKSSAFNTKKEEEGDTECAVASATTH